MLSWMTGLFAKGETVKKANSIAMIIFFVLIFGEVWPMVVKRKGLDLRKEY